MIEPDDAIVAGSLDIAHRDPFARALIVRGKRLGARIVTYDDAIRAHHGDCVW